MNTDAISTLVPGRLRWMGRLAEVKRAARIVLSSETRAVNGRAAWTRNFVLDVRAGTPQVVESVGPPTGKP